MWVLQTDLQTNLQTAFHSRNKKTQTPKTLHNVNLSWQTQNFIYLKENIFLHSYNRMLFKMANFCICIQFYVVLLPLHHWKQKFIYDLKENPVKYCFITLKPLTIWYEMKFEVEIWNISIHFYFPILQNRGKLARNIYE